MDMTVARRIERPGWINARTILGLVLFLTSLAAGRQLLQAEAAGTQVWVAARDLASNTSLGPGDVRLTTVELPLDQASLYATSSTEVEGAFLAAPVAAGELVPARALADTPGDSDARAITIPVSPEHAAGGDVTPGDKVDVVATFEAGTPRARTQVLVSGAEVSDTMSAGALMGDEASLGGITVSVPPEIAVHIAYAIRNGDIDIVRVDGRTGDAAGLTVRASEVGDDL